MRRWPLAREERLRFSPLPTTMKPAWSVPTLVFLNGSVMGALPGYMIVRYFPPIPTQAKTVNAQAAWLEYDFDGRSLRAVFCSMIVLAYILVASVFGRF